MSIPQFDPPGQLADLDPANTKVWSDYISDTIDNAIEGRADHTHDSPRAQFYNLTKTDTADDAQTAEVSWLAFPRAIRIKSFSDHQRWTRADASRDVQDEYCEWNVTRDATSKITRVTFTCEGPEYWEVLAETQPQTVVDLYRTHIDPSVAENDLFDAQGKYIQRNRWNNSTTQGAMHLIQGSNTLGAEIELGAAATIVRTRNGQILTSAAELIACAQYGDPERNSDPHIGEVVNSVAQQKANLALANPVGLYLKVLDTTGWSTPDGADPQGFWRVDRGDAEHTVRAVYEVPAAAGYTVSDITAGGAPIRFGAQIADFISVKLSAVACRFGQSTATPMECVGPATQPVAQQIR